MQSLRKMFVFTAVCIDLEKYNQKSCDMNILCGYLPHNYNCMHSLFACTSAHSIWGPTGDFSE